MNDCIGHVTLKDLSFLSSFRKHGKHTFGGSSRKIQMLQSSNIYSETMFFLFLLAIAFPHSSKYGRREEGRDGGQRKSMFCTLVEVVQNGMLHLWIIFNKMLHKCKFCSPPQNTFGVHNFNTS